MLPFSRFAVSFPKRADIRHSGIRDGMQDGTARIQYAFRIRAASFFWFPGKRNGTDEQGQNRMRRWHPSPHFDSGRGFRRFMGHGSETHVFVKSGKPPVQNRSRISRSGRHRNTGSFQPLRNASERARCGQSAIMRPLQVMSAACPHAFPVRIAACIRRAGMPMNRCSPVPASVRGFHVSRSPLPGLPPRPRFPPHPRSG